MSRTSKKRFLWFRTIAQRTVPLIVVGVVMIVGFFGAHWLVPSDDSPDDRRSDAAGDEAQARLVVTLTPEKEAAAGIHVSAAEVRELALTKTVAGILKYDDGKHVELRAPIDCLVSKPLVQPGQWVQAGEPLAILTSPDVGSARSEIARREEELTLARMEFEWAQQTHTNVQELLTLLGGDPTVAEVESQMEGKVLGEHRDALVSAYSQYQLARNVLNQSTSLESSGALTSRVVEQRQRDREVAAAHFKGACEESRFHSEKELVKARAHVDAAERALRVSHDTLRTLLGPYGAASQDECSSDFSLNAPIAGRIEELDTIAAVRFQVGERMIVLADTHSLWVAAQIHQRDWNVLQVDAGQLLKVAVPSLPELPLTAKVKFVGATVSPSTLTVPLVAEVSNPNDTLRPGMFVWVVVPTGPAHAALTVAAAAVQRQGEQSFVFVRDATHTYRRVEVELGSETPEWVEITRGVTAGDLVVDEGGFQLTSELLLEAEAEE